MLNDELRLKLDSYLQDDEEIIWADTPANGMHLGAYPLLNFIFGMPAILLGPGLFNLCRELLMNKASLSIGKFFDFLFVLALFSVQFYHLLLRYPIAALRARHTVYAVTNYRVIFLYPRRFCATSLLSIRDLAFAEKANGIGDVHFAGRYSSESVQKRKYGSRNTGGMNLLTDGYVFVNIENPRKVYHLIKSQRSKYYESICPRISDNF